MPLAACQVAYLELAALGTSLENPGGGYQRCSIDGRGLVVDIGVAQE